MKKNRSKKSRTYGHKELIFNVISLVLIICVGLYYGGRSFYWYSKLNSNIAEAVTTLNGSITTLNSIVTSGDGLHQDTDGFYFKGNVNNNYVSYANRIYRVIRVNNDGSVRVISDDIVGSFMWGEEGEYSKSNLKTWLNKTGENTGIYQDTLPYVQDYLTTTTNTQEVLGKDSIKDGKEEYKDLITTLTLKDYSNANGKNSFLNIGKYFWILGQDSNDMNLYIDEDGSIIPTTPYAAFGIRAVFTFKADILIESGDGTKDNPYTIKQGDHKNYVDTYVKLGNEVFKVYYDDAEYLKMVYTDYAGNHVYGGRTSLFDPYYRGSMAQYLNTTILNSMAYKDKLVDIITWQGEVSNDVGLDYRFQYSDFVTSKISVLGLFDYVNVDLDDFYLSTTTSNVGSMAYVYHNYGIPEEAKVTEERKMVPVLAIRREQIGEGKGTLEEPYSVR